MAAILKPFGVITFLCRTLAFFLWISRYKLSRKTSSLDGIISSLKRSEWWFLYKLSYISVVSQPENRRDLNIDR